MARCPRCTRHFRTLEDEEGMHDCPHCGYGPESVESCVWCNSPVGPDISDEEDYPYCSTLCAAQAERDSEEEN